MRYVLMPFTMFLWFLTAYYGIYIAAIGMAFMFSLSWIWLILGYTFLVGAVFRISNGIPGLLRFPILRLFGMNWILCIAHSFAAALGVIFVICFFSANAPQLVIGSESVFILAGMWKIAPIKTIFLAPAFLGITIAALVDCNRSCFYETLRDIS